MHKSILCRSPQEIRDDDLTRNYDDICSMLNAVCSGRCLYTGKRRAALGQIKAQIESEILGEGKTPAMLAAHVYAAMTL